MGFRGVRLYLRKKGKKKVRLGTMTISWDQGLYSEENQNNLVHSGGRGGNEKSALGLRGSVNPWNQNELEQPSME